MNTVRRLRADHGSLINTLVFVIVATGLIATMLGFYLMRSTNDYTTARQAEVKSAISQLATNLLGRVNTDFPADWMLLSSSDLKAASASMGEKPEMQANAHLAYFYQQPTNGVITADIIGESTTPGRVRVTATLKIVPTGAAVFKGVDANGRPAWIYSNENIDALALYELAPNAIQYIRADGSYDAEAPAQVPVVQFTATTDGAVASIGSVYCRFAGTAEYQIRYKVGADTYSEWGIWTTDQTMTFTLGEGDRVDVQARAHCVNTNSTSDPSAASNTASYTRPITTVLSGPQVTVTMSGQSSWTSVACPAGTSPTYRHQSRLNEGVWGAWTDWDEARSFAQTLPDGNLLEVQVQAHCVNVHASGPASTIGYGSAIAPLTYQPAAPTITIAGSAVITVNQSTCPAGTSVQTRVRYAIDGSSVNSAPWSGWGGQNVTGVAVNEGGRLTAQATQRCGTAYAQGPGSEVSATTVRNVPVVSVPNHPTVTLNSSSSSFSWPAASCPVGTYPLYKWRWVANGGSQQTSGSSWLVKPSAVGVSVYEGGTLEVWLSAVCKGFGSTGPSSGERGWSFVKRLTTAPSAPSITIASNTSVTWYASGCPAGTAIQYRWRKAVNGSAWEPFSYWGGVTSAPALVDQGDRVAVGVNVRCINPTTSNIGPTNYREAAYIRPVTAPAWPASISRGSYYYGIQWNAAACAAGTTGQYKTWFYRADGFDIWSGTGSSPQYNYSRKLPNGNTLQYLVHSRCINPSTGVASGWASRWAQWVGKYASGYPKWS